MKQNEMFAEHRFKPMSEMRCEQCGGRVGQEGSIFVPEPGAVRAWCSTDCARCSGWPDKWLK